MDTVWAIDPEQALLALDKAKSKEDARYATALANDAFGIFFELALDVAAIGEQKTKEELEKEELEHQRDKLNRINREISHNNSINTLNNIRNLWSTQAIRKTTLIPNHSLHGLILFPIHKYATFVSLKIPIENSNFTIDYKQVKYTSN